MSLQTGAAMEEVRHLVLGAEFDKRTALVLTGGAFATGALVVVVLRKVYDRQQAKEKIRRARTRRDESLCRAEEAVLQYRASVRATMYCCTKVLTVSNDVV